MCVLVRSHPTFRDFCSGLRSVGDLRHGHGPWDQVTALANRRTEYLYISYINLNSVACVEAYGRLYQQKINILVVYKKKLRNLWDYFTHQSSKLIIFQLNTNPNVCGFSIHKSLSIYPIRSIYHIVYLNYLFLLHIYITLPFNPLSRCWYKVDFPYNSKLTRTLVYTLYPGVHYLTAHMDVATHKTTPVPALKRPIIGGINSSCPF